VAIGISQGSSDVGRTGERTASGGDWRGPCGEMRTAVCQERRPETTDAIDGANPRGARCNGRGRQRFAAIMRAMRDWDARQWRRLALTAIAGGALARAVYILGFHEPLDYVYSDMQGYVEHAKLLAGGVTETDPQYTLTPGGTHILLAVPLWIFGSGHSGLWVGQAMWFAMSAATPYFMWRFASCLLSPAAAALTAVFCSAWVLFITNSSYFLSETPALFFLTASLWLAARVAKGVATRPLATGALAGLVAGAAMATRPQFALNLGLALIPLVAGRRWLKPAGALVGAGAVVIALLVVHNTTVADKFTLVSDNSGLNFFQAQCDVKTVTMSKDGSTYGYGAPPAHQRGDGRDYVFDGHLPGDAGFFYDQGAKCIRDDGVAHLRLVARNVVDMGATTVIWPQSTEEGLHHVVKIANILYALALPVIVVGSILLIRRRRRAGEGQGELYMLLHLACLLPTALLFVGDPRYRMTYDIFGFALLAALIAYHVIERPARARTAEEPAPVAT
jgi:4-amino-4-deoxy-L-arabinose transferase-like glycosyltransferase